MKTNVELISTRVYAGRLKDRENLNNSSSGGAFTALSDFFLKNLNITAACIKPVIFLVWTLEKIF